MYYIIIMDLKCVPKHDAPSQGLKMYDLLTNKALSTIRLLVGLLKTYMRIWNLVSPSRRIRTVDTFLLESRLLFSFC